MRFGARQLVLAFATTSVLCVACDRAFDLVEKDGGADWSTASSDAVSADAPEPLPECGTTQGNPFRRTG